jgi:hypothetical protein
LTPSLHGSLAVWANQPPTRRGQATVVLAALK